jgi:hypothetical protein
MTAGMVLLSVLLALALLASAGWKLTGRQDMVEAYARVGVPAHRLRVLAALLAAGAGGLLAGLVWRPIGIAAAGCLTIYFALALVAHARYDDFRHAGPPAVLLALTAAWLIFA